jgi:hypothetical protein
MNWTRLLDTHDFILPITARRVAGAILRRARLGDGSVAKYLPRGIRLRPDTAWTKHRDVDGEVEDLAPEDWPGEDWPNVVEGGGYAVAPILTKSYVQWLSSGPPSLGKVFRLAFRKKGALVELTICRIEASKVGREAQAHPPAVIRTEREDAAVDDRSECLSGGPARSRERPLQVVMPDHQRRARVPSLPSHRERGRDGRVQ